jgi:hypothetical protein
VRLPWKSRKSAQRAAEAAPAPPAPVPAPKRPQTGDDLRKAFLEKLDARADDKQA